MPIPEVSPAYSDALAILGLHMDQGAMKGDDTPWTMTAAHRRDLIVAASKMMELIRVLAKDPECDDGTGFETCFYCRYGNVAGQQHNDDCPWIKARALVDFLDGGGVS